MVRHHIGVAAEVAERINRDMAPALPVLRALDEARVQYALAGGLAYAFYVGVWRDTGDMDIVVMPEDRQRTIELVEACGFVDLHDQMPYDRRWIWRGRHDGFIFDVIWQMANFRAVVDPRWLSGRVFELLGQLVRAIPVEELILAKVFIIQRERCDWPDLMGLLHEWGARIDWEHLITIMGDDEELLASLLLAYRWMCPGQSAELPSWIWPRMRLAQAAAHGAGRIEPGRVRLLDSRPWFGPLMWLERLEQEQQDGGRLRHERDESSERRQ
jgi:hypothetical protein